MYKSEDDIPFVFGYRELAEIMDVSLSTARRVMNEEGFPVHRITPQKKRIFKGEFLRWMNGERFSKKQLEAF